MSFKIIKESFQPLSVPFLNKFQFFFGWIVFHLTLNLPFKFPNHPVTIFAEFPPHNPTRWNVDTVNADTKELMEFPVHREGAIEDPRVSGDIL